MAQSSDHHNIKPADVSKSKFRSWTLDSARNEYYYYSDVEKAYVYQNGRRVYTNHGDPVEQQVVESYHEEEITTTIKAAVCSVAESSTIQDTTSPTVSEEQKPHEENLNQLSEFKIRRSAKGLFILGKVFKAWWPDIATGENDNHKKLNTGSTMKRKVTLKVICFIVVREGDGFATCLPIFGDADDNSRRRYMETDHTASVWCCTSECNQYSKDSEVSSGVIRRNQVMSDVKVNPKVANDHFLDNSFVDFSKTCHVDHSNIVDEFGEVDDTYIDRLLQSWLIVLLGSLSLRSITLSESGTRHSPNKEITSKTDMRDIERMKRGSEDECDNKETVKCQDEWDMINEKVWR